MHCTINVHSTKLLKSMCIYLHVVQQLPYTGSSGVVCNQLLHYWHPVMCYKLVLRTIIMCLMWQLRI